MADMLIHAERVVRHSRRFYLRLCAFCDRALGLASAPAQGVVCEHGADLLALARQRVESLGRPAPEPVDPEPTPPRPRRGGRGRASAGVRRTPTAACAA